MKNDSTNSPKGLKSDGAKFFEQQKNVANNLNKKNVPSGLTNLNKNRILNNSKKNTNNDNISSSQTTEQTKKSTSSKLGSNLASGLGAASSLIGGDGNSDNIITKAKNLKKKLLWLKIFGPTVCFVLLWVVVIIIMLATVMTPIMAIGENIDNTLAAAQKTGDKLTNLIAGNGFITSSQEVSNRIQEAKEKYENYSKSCLKKRMYWVQASDDADGNLIEKMINGNVKFFQKESDEDFQARIDDVGGCIQGEFDEGILISTLQVYNTIDTNSYQSDSTVDASDNSNTYSVNRNEDFNKTEVDEDEVGSFYTNQAKVYLGETQTDLLDVANTGLLWNLVDYKITFECTKSENMLENFGDFMNSLDEFVSVFTSEIGVTDGDASDSNHPELSLFAKMVTGGFITDGVSNVVSIIEQMKAAKDSNVDFFDYIKNNYQYNQSDVYTDKNAGILRMLWNSMIGDSSQGEECGEKFVKVPVLIRYINYDNYVNYLKEVFIPSRFFNCPSCQEQNWTDEAKERITEDTITEILNQRNTYYQNLGSDNNLYLTVDGFGNYKVEMSGGTYSGGIYPVGTSGTGWKQSDPLWSNFELGNGSSTRMGKIGCYVTSIATIIANSKTKIKGDKFDPLVLAETIKANGGFTSSGSLSGRNWQNSWHSVAPNFNFVTTASCSSYAAECGNTISRYLDEGKYVIVEVPHHFVAVVGSDANGIIISDPAKGDTQERLDKYNGSIKDIRIFEKTD